MEVRIIDTMEFEVTDTKPNVVELLKEEIHETQNWDEGTCDHTLQLSQEDAWRLMKLSAAEAGNQNAFGQYLVMRVVLNRLNSEDYPDSIEKIISQRGKKNGKWVYQFQTYGTGAYEKAVPNVDGHLALAILEKNEAPDTEIIAFEANWNDQSLLRYYELAYVYKGHTFYRNKK